MEELIRVCNEYLAVLTPEACKVAVEAHSEFYKERQQFTALLTVGPNSEEMEKIVESTKKSPIAPFVVVTRAIRKINPDLFINDFRQHENGKLVVSLDTHVDTTANHELLDLIYTELTAGIKSDNIILLRWNLLTQKVQTSNVIINVATTLTKTNGKFNLYFLNNETKPETDMLLKVVLGKFGYKKLIGNQHYMVDVSAFNEIVRHQDYVSIPGGLLQPKFGDVIEFLKGELSAVVQSKKSEDELVIYRTLMRDL